MIYKKARNGKLYNQKSTYKVVKFRYFLKKLNVTFDV
jgi:hypothetical protein